jgi:FkbM family methyltransferase
MLNRWPATIKDVRDNRPDYEKLVEVLVAAVYQRFVTADSKVIDGGTNAGMHLFPLAQLVGPGGKVFGFEPNPEIVARIRQRIERDKLVQIEMFECAISDREGTCGFVLYPDKPAISHISHDGPLHEFAHGLQSTQISVRAVRLDDVVKEHISFIKFDLEGSDFLGLQGASHLLETSRPLVVFENGRGKAAAKFHYTPDDFFSFFEQKKYLLFDVHALPMTRDKWESVLVGWEAFAIPVEAAYTAVLLTFLQRFWASVFDWPLVTKWSECAALGRSLPSLRQI